MVWGSLGKRGFGASLGRSQGPVKQPQIPAARRLGVVTLRCASLRIARRRVPFARFRLGASKAVRAFPTPWRPRTERSRGRIGAEPDPAAFWPAAWGYGLHLTLEGYDGAKRQDCFHSTALL